LIPKLTCTQDALAFGKIATKEQIKEMQIKRQKKIEECVSLQNQGKFNAAMDVAVTAQLLREAIEMSTHLTPVLQIQQIKHISIQP